jgi:hypothetical protein
MDLTMMQKKKHLLLLNRIMRAELKKDIVPVPSKLTEGEVTQYFNKLFVKKDDYYVPIKNKVSLSIDEELFKDLIKKKKSAMTAEEKVKDKEMKKQKDEEMKSNVRKMIYTQFINNFVKPYNIKRKEGADYKNEEKALIEKYIKVSGDMKKLIKMELPKLWEAVLNPAFMEREKRKGELKEEDKKLMKDIKKEAKK